MIERLLALFRPLKSESSEASELTAPPPDDLCGMCGTPSGRGHSQQLHDEAVAAWRRASGLAVSEEATE